MTFEAALKAHLQTPAAITDVVGDRIYPVIRPQGSEPPAITYQIISMDDNAGLSGSRGGASGAMEHYRVQIDIWARKHSEMLAIEQAVRARMYVAASSFSAVLTPTGFDDYEAETKLYRRMQEWSCWYSV